MSDERFPPRPAGSTRGPLRYLVRDVGGSPRDLTGDTATLDIRPFGGGPAVVTGLAHTNTPGTAGAFEFQLTAAHVARPGTYWAIGRATLDGELEVMRKIMVITPTTE